jgi:hypothetical protein
LPDWKLSVALSLSRTRSKISAVDPFKKKITFGGGSTVCLLLPTDW